MKRLDRLAASCRVFRYKPCCESAMNSAAIEATKSLPSGRLSITPQQGSLKASPDQNKIT